MSFNETEHDGHEDEMHHEDDSNATLIAFIVVILAGLSTALGASVVFFPRLVKLASPRVLASGLGLSAGVMVYLALVELYPVAVNHFFLAGNEDGMEYLYAALSFLAGIVLMLMLNKLVHRLSPQQHSHIHERENAIEEVDEEMIEPCRDELCHEPAVTPPHCISCTDNPLGELSRWQSKAQEEVDRQDHAHKTNLRPIEDQTIESSMLGDGSTKHTVPVEMGVPVEEVSATHGHSDLEICDEDPLKHNHSEDHVHNHDHSGDHGHECDSHQEHHEHKTSNDDDHHHQTPQNRQLFSTGISTAIAIAIHNFPEGLATFVTTMEDPRIGVVLALAIGLHNIPEGLCVALPIYYSTGKRWRAFMWGCLSGLSEPLAALVAWAILAKSEFNDIVYAVLFGMVAGMMVIIALKELLPTAHRYDPRDTVVTTSLVVGIIIISFSLVLFEIVGQHSHGLEDESGEHDHEGDHEGE